MRSREGEWVQIETRKDSFWSIDEAESEQFMSAQKDPICQRIQTCDVPYPKKKNAPRGDAGGVKDAHFANSYDVRSWRKKRRGIRDKSTSCRNVSGCITFIGDVGKDWFDSPMMSRATR